MCWAVHKLSTVYVKLFKSNVQSSLKYTVYIFVLELTKWQSTSSPLLFPYWVYILTIVNDCCYRASLSMHCSCLPQIVFCEGESLSIPPSSLMVSVAFLFSRCTLFIRMWGAEPHSWGDGVCNAQMLEGVLGEFAVPFLPAVHPSFFSLPSLPLSPIFLSKLI